VLKFALILILTTGAHPALGEWTTHIYGSHGFAATSETTNVPESSGAIASRTNSNVFWTHNDSGGSAVVYAFRLSAADKSAGEAPDLGYVYLNGASNVDWEDISAGPDGMIYAFDGGDNPPCSRTNKRIYRFTEPVVDPDGAPIALFTTYDTLRFEYPDPTAPELPADQNDERYDSECLFIHPDSGDIYIVTKRNNNNSAVAYVYKLPASSITWNTANLFVLQFVADLSSVISSTITGGDIHADGKRIVIRNYSTAYEFILAVGEPFDAIFQQSPITYSLTGEWGYQGEAICYTYFDGDIVTTSEASPRFRISNLDWQLANTRAEDVTSNSAVVRWDTAQPLDSQVDYGMTVSYGQSESDGSEVISHAISLSALTAGQQYFYRVQSGSLEYPDTARASDLFFITAQSTLPSDFDEDGDVDLEDFGHLQGCFTGNHTAQTEPDCMDACLDADSDVDNDDLTIFKGCMSGAGVSYDPNGYP